MGNPFDADPILVEVVRNGYVESVHRGRVAITEPDGRLADSVGAEFAPMYPRSALKPLQAVGMLRAGLDLTASCWPWSAPRTPGEPMHIDGVREILAAASWTRRCCRRRRTGRWTRRRARRRSARAGRRHRSP